LLFIATGAIASSIGVYVLDYFRRLFLGRGYVPPPHVNELYFFLGLLAGLRGAITIGGLAAAIKLMKYWYMKEQRNLQLQKENIAAQLQLLKAQVHPHFLFNTLNNIYAHTQVSSPIASGMIIKLSELLRYMLYECNQSLVPLTKEFNMLRDYISLEQIRYGNKPDLNIDLPETSDELYIAPLLLLPFIENSFKHGASHMLEQPWISLQISINDLELKMKLLNGKNPHSSDAHGGIGIDNVKKRLELLYPQQHQLSINNEEEVFIVNLSVQLEQRKTSETALTSKNKMIHA
jgi:LytS/YehU family sensor histidine kinase